MTPKRKSTNILRISKKIKSINLLGGKCKKCDENNIFKLCFHHKNENDKKIFLKYISNENIFGFSDSSYFATSDTYFLWPKNSETKLELDYTFLLAYLNSKLVYFLFKAKNISIKRSKTKLEYGLPVPNINNFNSCVNYFEFFYYPKIFNEK